jgi:hypothetical protein
MPQVWIAIFFILLAMTELYQSIEKIDLPFPVYLVLGTLLAIASNYHQHQALFTQDRTLTLPENEESPVLTSIELPILPISTNNHAEISESIERDRA